MIDNPDFVRLQIFAINAKLSTLDDEQKLLRGIIRAYEQWLALLPAPPTLDGGIEEEK